MTIRLLWPSNRWGDDLAVEREAAGAGVHIDYFRTSADVPEETWRKADGIVSGPNPVTAENIHVIENCRILVTPKVGFDNIDLELFGRNGIPVCNVPDYGTMEVADHAIALMMTLVKSTARYDDLLRKDPRGNWTPRNQPLARRLSVTRFGVVGLGRIGTAAALRAKAFGMDVRFYDPYLRNGVDLSVGVTRVRTLEELFAASDIVSIHAPLSDETRNLIGADILGAAKPGLVLINTARGEIVDLDALHDALRSGQVAAAGLDVLPQEPANTNHALIAAWHNDEDWIRHRLVLTPHAAFFTPQSARDMRAKAAEVAVLYLKDGELWNCVNEEYLVDRR